MNLIKISLVVFIFFLSCHLILKAQYRLGRYEGNSKGVSYHNDSGIIEVEVVMSESTIDSIKITKYDQTTRHKKYGEPVRRVRTELPKLIIKNKSLEVDGISSATVSSNTLLLAVADALGKAKLRKFTCGKYIGSAYGRRDSVYDGTIEIEVNVSDSIIVDAKIILFNQNIDHKRFGYYTESAKKKIPSEIIKQQKINVDAVSQATMTSNGIKLAFARAIEKAYKK